jgi:diguanylate cyclase (GGDEF)-like protein
MPSLHPSLVRPSMFAAAWHVATWFGLALLVWSCFGLDHGGLQAMSPQILMITALIVLSELRPVVMTRLEGNPVSISLAFVFAAMYLWGLAAGVVLMALLVVLSEILQRKPLWKVLFNVGQYVLSLGAAWVIVLLFGTAASPTSPNTSIGLGDLWWMVLGWAVYHVINIAFVACLSASDDLSWWESFSEEWWFYTVSAAAVLALSPLIAVIAVAGPGTWALLPLLLVPLLAVQKAAEMSRENERQALHDPLTGLPNRLLLADRIGQALARSDRVSGKVTVLFLDVDLFKVVNDSLGHAAGDGLLMELARRLTTVLRPGDTLARFGGDEFVIVCDNIPDEEVEPLAARVAGALDRPFTLEGHDVNVSVSIGIAVSRTGTDAQTMLRDADAALYRAKAGGRSRAVVFDEGMHDEAAHRFDAESGLRRALDRDELCLYYQPIVSIRTGDVCGVEALVRWQHPQRGLLGPLEFVSVAEETGLIVPLGSWVLGEAVRQLAEWRAEVPAAADLWVSVNVSPRQLKSTDLVPTVARLLAENGIPESALRLELTESALVDAAGPQVEAIAAVTRLGIGFAVDDFGTGYSSLAYLAGLPVTTLKVDRTFVAPLGGSDSTAMAIVDAIVSMARALRLDVIAEGVESPQQLTALRRLGAPQGQGYLWSPPLPADEVPGWLAAFAARD